MDSGTQTDSIDSGYRYQRRTQPNKVYVRAYYQRNKSQVINSKVLARCRKQGSIPTYETMVEHDVKLDALCLRYAEWAGTCAQTYRIRSQSRKLQALVDRCTS
jgi:hypothetical protein